MNLPSPPTAYDATDQAQMRTQIEAADALNIKNTTIIKSLKWRDTDGTLRKVVITAGAFVIT